MIGTFPRPIMEMESFRLLQEYVYERSGIRLGMDQSEWLAGRLQPILQKYDLESFADLYSYARYHHQSAIINDELIESLTTHETYLYRESFQFELLTRELLGKREDFSSHVRILSAGCSSGEELVSLVILLHEAGFDNRYSFEFVGADISGKIMQKAREGRYRESSFRAAPEHWMGTYFEPGREPYTWILKEEIRRLLDYVKLNLLDPFRLRVLGAFDIVFCRNVMIYFDQDSKQRLVDLLYRRIRPGGYLFLGHAESLIQLDTQFIAEQFIRDIIYRKPMDSRTG